MYKIDRRGEGGGGGVSKNRILGRTRDTLYIVDFYLVFISLFLLFFFILTKIYFDRRLK